MWWMCSAAMLSYAIARTIWSIDDLFIYRHGVPFPILPDLFFVLQYPFLILAIVFIPSKREWAPRLIVFLDVLLCILAAITLSWFFLLAPLYGTYGLSPLARTVSLSYPVGDLFIFIALTLALIRPMRYQIYRPVLVLLVVAFACLILADSWVNEVLLSPGHVYKSGGVPDLFWVAFYLLVPLAALVQLRMAQREPQHFGNGIDKLRAPVRLRWDDVKASLRFFVPLAAALLVSTAILIHAMMRLARENWSALIAPLTVSAVLLMLVLVRQEIAYVENVRLRRESAQAEASALALRQTTERMGEFLATASHDLRTPMGAVVGYMDLASRLCGRLSASVRGSPCETTCPEVVHQINRVNECLEEAGHGSTRLVRVVNMLFETTQARAGTLDLHLEPCDLGEIVRGQVDILREVNPNRTIDVVIPDDTPLRVVADAERIGQVVTHYLTNALKYSTEDQPVEVGIVTEGTTAFVCVLDQGPGIPSCEQDRIWQRFYRVPTIAVQSGTNIGLGLGLHLSKLIVEQHGGRVGVTSAVGRGSNFWFTLPLAPRADANGHAS
jgi:signal transduction histidine kinase